jgi:hypothetical protein
MVRNCYLFVLRRLEVQIDISRSANETHIDISVKVNTVTKYHAENKIRILKNNIVKPRSSFILITSKSRGSAVGIATAYGLDGLGVGVRVPIEVRFFSLSCRAVLGPGSEADHSTSK